MREKDTFSSYNPIICFVFFISAVVFGMFFIHPAFLICSLVMSVSYMITVRGSKAFKMVIGILPVFVVMSVINPLFNTYGEHILFTYMNGRVYTLEALMYGMAIAAMFVTMLLWFSSYNAVMTSDKFIYMFGKTAPAVSLTLSLIMRLVPGFQKKAGQIEAARKCIGKAGSFGTKRERLENSMTVISTLTGWALEGGIVTADSMSSRGYGSGPRTNFAIYRFDGRDIILLMVMLGCISTLIICGIMGGSRVTYTPEISIEGLKNPFTILGVTAYFILLSIPTVLNISEAITWHILRSKI